MMESRNILCCWSEIAQETWKKRDQNLLIKFINGVFDGSYPVCSLDCRCEISEHVNLMIELRQEIVKTLMSALLEKTNNSDDPNLFVRYLIDSDGKLLIKSLTSFSVYGVVCCDKLYTILLYTLSLRFDNPDAELLDEAFTSICSDILHILTSISQLKTTQSEIRRVIVTHLVNLYTQNMEKSSDILFTSMINSICECSITLSDITLINDIVSPRLIAILLDKNQAQRHPEYLPGIVKLLIRYLDKPEILEPNLKHMSTLIELSLITVSQIDVSCPQIINILTPITQLLKTILNSKIRHIHDAQCRHKKHRKCDWRLLANHHSNILVVNKACLHQNLVNILYQKYQSAASKHNQIQDSLLTLLSDISPCCCMNKSELSTLVLTDYHQCTNEQKKTVIGLYTNILLTNTNQTGKLPVVCAMCSSHRRSSDSEKYCSVELLYNIVSESLINDDDNTTLNVTIETIRKLAQCEDDGLIYELYLKTVRPLLERITNINQQKCVNSACTLLNCTELIINKDVSARDHFISSSSSMRILETCVSAYTHTLPHILKLLRLLLSFGDEEQVVILISKLLFNEAEVTNTDNQIVFNYPLPSLPECLESDDMYSIESLKWRFCLDVLNENKFYRNSFQSQSAVRHVIQLLNHLVIFYYTYYRSHDQSHDVQKNTIDRVKALLSIVLSICMLCVKYTLNNDSTGQICTCTEILSVFEPHSSELFSPDIIMILLDSSVGENTHTDKPAISNTGRDMSRQGSRIDNRDETSSDLLSSYEDDGYDADLDSVSIRKSSTPQLYNSAILMPDIWLFVLDMMTACHDATSPHIKLILNRIYQILNAQYNRLYHAARLSVSDQLMDTYKEDIINNSAVGQIIMNIITLISACYISTHTLFKLLKYIKQSTLQKHLLQFLESIISNSVIQPTDAILFPITSDGSEDLAVIQKSLSGSGTFNLSLNFWIYVNSGVAAGYNTAGKDDLIKLVGIRKSKLVVVLSCHLTRGYMNLSVLNNGQNIGNFHTTSLLNTNEWQMISLCINIKSKQNQIHMQYGIGIDGKEVICDNENLNTSTNPLANSTSDLVLEIGQKTSRHVTPESIQLANILVFSGMLNECELTFLYISGSRFNSLTKCKYEEERLSGDIRNCVVKSAHESIIQKYLDYIHEDHLSNIRSRLLMVISPRYRPCCLSYPYYSDQTSSNVVMKLLKPAPTRLPPVHIQPQLDSIAYDASLNHHTYDNLLENLQTLGGVKLLLYLFALSVDLGCEAEVQYLSVSCLLKVISGFVTNRVDRFDYRMLAKVLQNSKCHIENITELLISHCTRKIANNVILSDTEFIEQILLDWRIWQSRPSAWSKIWDCLLLSLSKENSYIQSNIKTLLDCEILQIACSIPQHQFQYEGEKCSPIYYKFIDISVSLSQTVLKQTLEKKLLSDLCNLVILIHPAANTYIQYEVGLLFTSQSWYQNKNRRSLFGSSADHPTSRPHSQRPLSDTTDASHKRRLSRISTDTRRLFDDPIDESFGEFTVVISGEQELEEDNSSDSDDTTPHSSDINKASSPFPVTTDSEETDLDTPQPHYPTCRLPPQPHYTTRKSNVDSLDEFVIIDSASDIADSYDVKVNQRDSLNSIGERLFPDCCRFSTEPDPENTIDADMIRLSSNLLHMLQHITEDMTYTDKLIFINDLMSADTLLVLLNHESNQIRFHALKLLLRVLEISPETHLDSFIKKRGLHMISSQLSQHEITSSLLTLTTQFIYSEPLRQASSHPALNALPLLGCLKSSFQDIRLACQAFTSLYQILDSKPDYIEHLLEHGLIQVLTNCISIKWDQSDTLLSERLISYILSIYQLISNSIVRTNSMASLRTLINVHLILDRTIRINTETCGGNLLRRIESVLCHIFNEVCDSIKSTALSVNRSQTKYQRVINMVTGGTNKVASTLPVSPTSENLSFSYSSRMESRRDSVMSLASSTSLSRSQSLAYVGGIESRVNQSTLSTMLIFILQECSGYCLYKDKTIYRSRQLLMTFTDILMELHTDTHNKAEIQGTIWSQIVSEQKINTLRLNLTSTVLSMILSPCCSNKISEKCLYKFYMLSDNNLKQLIQTLPITDDLTSNVNLYLSTRGNKTSVQIFLSPLSKRLHTLQPPDTESHRDVTTERFNKHRTEWKNKLTKTKKQSIRALDKLNKEISNCAMEINKQIILIQNLQRKKFVEKMKNSIASNVMVRDSWNTLIEQLTHEQAVWHDPETYPMSWEINPTEGPHRVRRRLQRCHIANIGAKFLLPAFKHKAELLSKSPPLTDLLKDSFGQGPPSAAIIYRLHTSEKIMFTCKCSEITCNKETLGELLISDGCIYFVGDKAIMDSNEHEIITGDIISISWNLEDIQCFYKRRHQLQDKALEIFLTTGSSCLLATDSTRDRDQLWDELHKLKPSLPNLLTSADLESVQSKWINGQITNWDYLIQLNTLAGRSFNDLMQYPVFPFVISDYQSTHLDLTNIASYRKLNKPISCQLQSNEDRYKKHYKMIESDNQLIQNSCDTPSHLILGPYHYASHYSNSGVVLHYLVRLLPYTHMFLKYQDGQFDIPDRTFHSMSTSYSLTSENSNTDVKELIPEFYSLPEFMMNYEGLDLGLREKGQRVNDLNLPVWCNADPRLFVLVLRQALESVPASTNLQNWINLIFGFQQQGKAAIEATNIFHPSTYFGLEVDSIEDELHRESLRVMIRTYGQMPKQLFKFPHPPQQTVYTVPNVVENVPAVLENVSGLIWGNYIGSPSENHPEVARDEVIGASKLVTLSTGDLFGLNTNSYIITHQVLSATLQDRVDVIWASLITYHSNDRVLRITSRKERQPYNLLSVCQKVSAVAAAHNCSKLIIATESGEILVYQTQFIQPNEEYRVCGLYKTLTAHKDKITQLVVSPEFGIIITADYTGKIIIWDLNELIYVRTLYSSTDCNIESLAVSKTLGDLAFSSTVSNGTGCVLELYTINGYKIQQCLQDDIKINFLSYSATDEGRSVNVIAAALTNATIRLYSSWDLKLVRTIQIPPPREPVLCCMFTDDNMKLAATTSGGRLLIWHKQKPGNTSLQHTTAPVRFINMVL